MCRVVKSTAITSHISFTGKNYCHNLSIAFIQWVRFNYTALIMISIQMLIDYWPTCYWEYCMYYYFTVCTDTVHNAWYVHHILDTVQAVPQASGPVDSLFRKHHLTPQSPTHISQYHDYDDSTKAESMNDWMTQPGSKALFSSCCAIYYTMSIQNVYYNLTLLFIPLLS